MKQLDKAALWLERTFIMVAFLIMVAVTFAQVIARFVFENPISWSEEVARFLFIWITMMGACHAIAYGKHFSVDFLLSQLPSRLQQHIGWIISLCVFAFAALMLGYGAYTAWFTRNQVSPALLIPMSYPYLCVPLSGLFMIIHLVAHRVGGGAAVIEAVVAGAEEGGCAE